MAVAVTDRVRKLPPKKDDPGCTTQSNRRVSSASKHSFYKSFRPSSTPPCAALAASRGWGISADTVVALTIGTRPPAPPSASPASSAATTTVAPTTGGGADGGAVSLPAGSRSTSWALCAGRTCVLRFGITFSGCGLVCFTLSTYFTTRETTIFQAIHLLPSNPPTTT